MEGALSLEEVLRVARRRPGLLLALPLLFALAAFAWSKLSPDVYQSEALLTAKKEMEQEAAALAEGLRNQLKTQALAKRIGDQGATAWASVRYDPRTRQLKLAAQAEDPKTAKTRADALFEAAQGYFAATAKELLRAELSQRVSELEAELEASRAYVGGLRERLAALPQNASTPPTPTTAAALESAGVEPLVAGQPNPARALLEVELAKAESALAQKAAELEQKRALLADEAKLEPLVQGRIPFEVVARPGVPNQPNPKHAVLNTLLALLFGALLAGAAILLEAATRSTKR